MRWRALLASGAAVFSIGPVVAVVASPVAPALGSCSGAVAGPAGGALSYAQLEAVWVQADGPAAAAPTAAAVAMAESGGRAIMQQGQPYGRTGWSYWQITPGNSEPQFGVDAQLFVPINGARAAVAKYTAAHGFTPWATFTSGAYLAYMHGGSVQAASPAPSACAAPGQVIDNAQLGPTTDPVPGAAITRLDMGLDGTSQTFLAPFSGTVAYSTASDSGWQGGGYVAVQSAQDPSMCFYAAEGLTPVVQQGQVVQVGQVIATPRPSPYNGIVGNMEVGQCYPQNPRDTLAHNVADPRGMVMAFYAWMEGLGAGPTTNAAGAGYA